MYTRAGRASEVALATYPEVSLKVARDRRDEERGRLAQGEHPAEHKRTAKAKQRILFRDVADEWLALQVKPNANGKVTITGKSAQKQRQIVHTHLCPMLGNRPIGSITSPELLEALREIEAKGLNQTAHNALGLASRMFCYGIATGSSPRDRARDEPLERLYPHTPTAFLAGRTPEAARPEASASLGTS